MRKALFLFIALLLTGCAQTLKVSYGDGPGTVHLRPTKKTIETFVSVNNRMMIWNANIHEVIITGLPEGSHDIRYGSTSNEYKDSLDANFIINIPEDSGKTEIISTPRMSTGYLIVTGLAVSIIAILLL